MALPVTRVKKLKAQASQLVSTCNIKKPPVSVTDIAKKLNLEVIPYNLGDAASGILIIENNKGTIGYNPGDSKVRQRFTIAHEIAHYVLHKDKAGVESVFVDRDFLVKKYRNANSYSGAEFDQEQEANTFAAELLMPETFMHTELAKKEYADFSEPQLIEKLAKVFNVSSIAMTYRVASLNAI